MKYQIKLITSPNSLCPSRLASILYLKNYYYLFCETIGFVYLRRLHVHGKDDLRMYYVTFIGWNRRLNNVCDILFMLRSCLMLAHICYATEYVFLVVLYVTNICDTMLFCLNLKNSFTMYNIKAAGIRMAQMSKFLIRN